VTGGADPQLLTIPQAEVRQSPVRFLGHRSIRRVAEALRRQPHGSQEVLEVHSSLILKPVR
jgi:hypothetical protein